VGPFRGGERVGTVSNVVVRISSAGIDPHEGDRKPPDLRGLAVRVTDPPTKEEYDLLATNAAVHHLKNVRRVVPFSRFSQAVRGAGTSVDEMMSGSRDTEALDRMREMIASAGEQSEPTLLDRIAGISNKLKSDLEKAGKKAEHVAQFERALKR